MPPLLRWLQIASQEGQIFFNPKTPREACRGGFLCSTNKAEARLLLFIQELFCTNAVVFACSSHPGLPALPGLRSRGSCTGCKAGTLSSLQGTNLSSYRSCLLPAHLCDTIKLLKTKIHCCKACSLPEPFPLWTLPADTACRCNSSSSPKLTPRALSVKFSFGRNGCSLQPPSSRPPWTQLGAEHLLNYPPQELHGCRRAGFAVPGHRCPRSTGVLTAFEKKRERPSSGCCKAFFCLVQKS